ncbi:serine/threonine protein kinase [bacterium]|nr:serine/threonine protein kinase [bacterium]
MGHGTTRDDERYTEVQAVFLAALDVPDAERHDFIRRRCGPDADLYNRVLRLLATLDADAADLEPIVDAGDFMRLLGVNGDGCVDGYRLERLLGRGGMGVVYGAREVDSGREVVLKFLRPGFGNDRVQERFAREIAVLARLRHPGICRYVGTGHIDTVVGTMPYLAMEHVAGQPLDRYADGEQLDVRARVGLVAAICEALGHAHAAHVVHRDLKPANIIVDDRGCPRLLDFGVATVIQGDLAATLGGQTAAVVGTVDYMAPEQVHDAFGSPDPRTDVFAVGVLLFELVCGRRPFGRNHRSAPRILASILMDPTPPLECRDGLDDPQLEMVVSRCLAKRPEERFADGRELALALQNYLAETAQTSPLRRGVTRMRWRSRRIIERAGPGRIRAAAIAAMLLLATWMAAARLGPSPAADRGELVAQTCRRLEDVTGLIHVQARTPASLNAALDLLAVVRTDIGALGGKPPAPALDRFAHWRRGEAWYFLGTRDDDRDLLWQACCEFEAAINDLPPAAYAGLDTLSDLYDQIAFIRAPVARAGYAGALEALAEIHRSTYFLDGAFRERSACLGPARYAADQLAMLLAAPEPDPGLYLDYGRLMALRGLAADDTTAVAEGLAILAVVDDDAIWARHDWRAAAWYQEAYGLALRAEGTLTGRAGPLHAARARYEKALQIRGVDGGRTRYAATIVELGMAALALAELESSPEVRADWLTRAADSGRQALALLDGEPGAVEPARAAQLVAEATAGLAVARRDAALLPAAWLVLDGIDGRIEPSRHPIPAARRLLSAAALAHAEAMLASSADPLAACASWVREAEALETAGQSPLLWREWERRRTMVEGMVLR